MPTSRAVLVPVFLTAALLLSSNGLLGTLVPVRAGIEGYSINAIGLIGGAYYLGFMLGCAYSAQFVSKVGHIRAFAAFAAVGAAGALLHVIIVDVAAWIVIRAFAGVCFAGQFVVLESWLNEMTDSSRRGRTLGIYRVVDMTAVVAGQYMLAFGDPATFFLFNLIAIFYALSLVPISSSRQPTPNVPPNRRIRLLHTLNVSPLAFWGVFAAGLTNGGFRSLGPVVAQSFNMSMAEIATFMNAMMIGGALMQIPFGWMSDRVDRRAMLLLTSIGAAAGGALVAQYSADSANMAAATVLVFGAFAMPLFSISLAHANDFAKEGDFVQLSASLMLVYGLGAAVGPLIGSAWINWYGPAGFFVYTSVIHVVFLAFAVVRAVVNRIKPRAPSRRSGPCPGPRRQSSRL